MYDAIVVGARCAGSPTAMLLARAGHRVLLLERATFPRDTLSTHVIHQPGVAALNRWGMLDALRATGCPPIEHTVYTVADITVAGCARGVDGQRAAFSPRRHILDTLLLDAAAAAGVEVRQDCSVTGLVRDADDRVIGVEGRHGGGRFREQARLVVGADGMRSTVARLVEAPDTVRDPLLTCAYYSYWQDLPVAGLELREGPGSWVAAVPTHDATLVLTYFPQERFAQIRGDAEAAHADLVRRTAPDLYERLMGARRLERLRGTGDQQNFVRRASGPGWALVGDAGHHKDSITARGITDAFHQAELLAEHVGGRLDGDPSELDAALRDYGNRRDRDLTPGYDATLTVAKLEPPHDNRLALLRAIQRDAELTSIYFDVFAGTVSPSALYTPRLLELLADE